MTARPDAASVVEPGADAAARPRLHYTPARNWMNDPNGLVFHRGRWHLYYQYNPEGAGHANMSWGHASSADLMSWTEHPVAIPYDEDGDIFSGSIVVDEGNTSGFGTLEGPPLVAIYTLAADEARHQSQALAYSVDDGRTWTKYAGNPVYDRGSANFRDPKVFRYDGPAGAYWVMVAVEAEDRQVLISRSDDLISWRLLSTYGPAGAVGGVWECPDLFPLPLDGDPDDERWVLLISLNPGGIAGGSGTQVVVGEFDGVTFTPQGRLPEASVDRAGFAGQSRAELERVDWLDRGRDCYAGVTFFGTPRAERVLIAWMSNWDYAHHVPSAPWRGSMTLPRRLELVTAGGRPRLRQTVIAPAGEPTASLTRTTVREPRTLDLGEGLPEAAHIELRVRLGDAAGFALRLRHDAAGHGGVLVLYDAESGRIGVDRLDAGAVHESFPSVDWAPLVADDGVVELDLWLDTASIELVAAGGLVTVTDLVFTDGGADGVTISGLGDELVIERLVVTDLGGFA